MKKITLSFISLIFVLYIVIFLFGVTPSVNAENKPQKKSGDEQLLTRIDFGNSYINGQTLKSGAVYLLQRKKTEMKTMLKYREKYRKEILEDHDIAEKTINGQLIDHKE